MDVASADQDKWCEMVAVMRFSLEKRIAAMSEMSSSELDSFVRAVSDCLVLEIKANTYDVKLEKEQAF